MNIILSIALFSVFALFSSCTEGESIDNADPTNLLVELLSIDFETTEVELQATALNAVEFQFFIDKQETPIVINETGYFIQPLGENKVYDIEVRAYGASKRYVKNNIQLNLNSDTVGIDDGYITPQEYDGYKMLWADEFSGNSINTSNWDFNIGDGCPNICGWGNNELEYYRKENAWVGDNTLTIEAREQSFSGKNYTSAKLISKNKISFKYGRVDIRALLPQGQGIWPALWLLGNNINEVAWPGCGEIDIMEMIGGYGQDNQVHGTIHYDNDGHIYVGETFTLQMGNFNEAYHVFSLIWTEESLKWYVDDQLYYEVSIIDANMSEFHQEYYFILNVAVGGNWPGNPDSSTTFPQQMKVDYIRVFQEN